MDLINSKHSRLGKRPKHTPDPRNRSDFVLFPTYVTFLNVLSAWAFSPVTATTYPGHMIKCVHSIFTDVGHGAAYHAMSNCAAIVWDSAAHWRFHTVPCVFVLVFFFRIWLHSQERWWNKGDGRVKPCPSRLDLGKWTLSLIHLTPSSGTVRVSLHVCCDHQTSQIKRPHLTHPKSPPPRLHAWTISTIQKPILTVLETVVVLWYQSQLSYKKL